MRTRTEYRFSLSRRQRLLPLLRAWGLLAVLGLFAFITAISAGLSGHWSAWLVILFLLFIMRGMLFGLAFIILRRRQPMCIAIEEQGIGFGDSQPDWWIFTDGIIGFRRTFDIWTVYHHNGTLLHIPADVISSDDVAFLKSKATKGA
jgi:hypothetical protein